ncbi:glycosyltransferase [Candidatus Kapabacteria bacterium]|nr:glycosyltransferase [Candidatus Kapabacteria bacterium]
MKIAVSIVTYNRLNFLKDLIIAIQNQTLKPDYIIVTNNSSNDGTEDWLKAQNDIKFITQENVGSSGGQYRSIKECMKTDADYFWIMDDDVIPEPDCLFQLSKEITKDRLIAPLRRTSNGEIFYNEPKSFNLSWPFKSIWNDIIDKEYLSKFENFVPAIGLTFEGPMFHRSLIEKVGMPEYDFFIHADDTEFMIKASKQGYHIGLIKSAILHRRLPAPDPRDEFTWKHYYIIRNLIAIDKLHGNFFVSKLRPYFYKYRWMNRTKSIEEKKVVKNAFKDGWNYKLDRKR